MHIFVCAWACGCIRTHQQLRQISVIWWPEPRRQNEMVPFLSLFCLFFPPCQIIIWLMGYFQSHCRFSTVILPPHFDLISPCWQTEPSKPIWACSASAEVGVGVGVGVMALLRQKKSDALFYFSPTRPLVLPFEILMLDGNPLWNCVMLGWVVWSQKWQLYLAITGFWFLGYVYVYKKRCSAYEMDALLLLQRIHHDGISEWH